MARRIKELRKLRHLTQEQLAEALDIATKNVQRLEGGTQNLTLKTLQLVADALDVEPYELLLVPGSGVVADPARSFERALRVLEQQGHRVTDGQKAKPRGAVPVMTLAAAASQIADAREVEVRAWLKLNGLRPTQTEGRFVAQVVGRSMAPRIPNGALCLFRAPVVGPLEGRIVLAQLRHMADPETGGAYAVKRVGPIGLQPARGLSVSLLSDNPEFRPIVIEARGAAQRGVLAEFERVIWPVSPRRPNSTRDSEQG